MAVIANGNKWNLTDLGKEDQSVCGIEYMTADNALFGTVTMFRSEFKLKEALSKGASHTEVWYLIEDYARDVANERELE